MNTVSPHASRETMMVSVPLCTAVGPDATVSSLKARAGLLLDLPDEAWFNIELMQKDVALALEAGRRLPVSLPSVATADQMLTVARAMGYGERDLAGPFAVLAHVSDDSAG